MSEKYALIVSNSFNYHVGFKT